MKQNTGVRGVYLPPATVERADRLARMAGVSRSRLIRELIERTTVVRPMALEMNLKELTDRD